jgi:hypothetical protein
MVAVPDIPGTRGRLDFLGGTLLALSLSLATGALSQRSLFGLNSVLPFVIALVGVLAIVLLVVVERRALEPIVSRVLFTARRFAGAMSAQLLVGAALIMALVTVPLMTDTILGEEPLEGGLRLMRFTGAIPFGAILGGYVVRWTGVRIPTIAGLLLGAAGFFLMSTWDESISDPQLSIHLAVGGFGFGRVIAPLVVSAIESVTERYRGTAAAWITVARMLGMTLGLAALSAWGMGEFQLLTANLEFPFRMAGETVAEYQRRLDAYNAGVSHASFEVFRAFFRVGAGLSLAAIIPAVFTGERNQDASPDA